MILDPLYGHSQESKRIEDPNLRESLKELAQLGGAFMVSDEGVVSRRLATSTRPPIT